MQKIFVGPDKRAILHCPACGQPKAVDLAKYFSSSGPVRLTYRFTCDNCDCGHVDCEICPQKECGLDNTNTVRLERRRGVRKNTRLSGKLQLGKSRPRDVWVVDISLHGAKIDVPPMFEIASGALGMLSISLDDKMGSVVNKGGKVLRVVNNQAVFLFDENMHTENNNAFEHYLIC